MTTAEIAFLLRTFRRHYHKTRASYKKLSESEGFSLELRMQGDKMTMRNTTPDEALTVRFIVLMRRFLLTSDRIHYESTWRLICEKFRSEISDNTIDRVDDAITQLKKGALEINVDGEQLTAEQIYGLISRTEYFHQDVESRKQLQGLVETVGPVLMHQFYEFSLNAFNLVSWIFDIIQGVEQSRDCKDRYTIKDKSADFTKVKYLEESRSPIWSIQGLGASTLGPPIG
jgi:hypothetical protein